MVRTPEEEKPGTDIIRKYAAPGETLAVWGWAPKYYLDTGLSPATREPHTLQYLFGSERLREYYVSRYVADMKASDPPVFVETVSSESFFYKDRATQGYEAFAELAGFIARNYTPVAAFSPSHEDSIRIYVSNRRLAERDVGD